MSDCTSPHSLTFPFAPLTLRLSLGGLLIMASQGPVCSCLALQTLSFRSSTVVTACSLRPHTGLLLLLRQTSGPSPAVPCLRRALSAALPLTWPLTYLRSLLRHPLLGEPSLMFHGALRPLPPTQLFLPGLSLSPILLSPPNTLTGSSRGRGFYLFTAVSPASRKLPGM